MITNCDCILEETLVCTGCAVTERFALKTKYFYDKVNLESFWEEYEQIMFHKKAMENKPLIGGSVLVVLLFVLGAAIAFGII